MVQTDAADSRTAGVLIVEGDAAIQEMVTQALSAEGYRVLSVPAVAPALDLLASGESGVDAVLLDPRLPGASGEAFAARYRRLPEPGPPVLVFTTSPAVEAALTAEALGAAGFVTKPFNLDVLLEVFGRCVATRLAPLGPRPGGWVPSRGTWGLGPSEASKDASAKEVRRRRLTRLRGQVGRIREELPRLQETLRELSVVERQRRLGTAEAQRVTILRRQCEALRLELNHFREEFEQLRASA